MSGSRAGVRATAGVPLWLRPLRLAILSVASGLVALAVASPAIAAPTLVLAPATGGPGTSVEATANGFDAGSTVTFWWGGLLLGADPDGQVRRISFEVPPNASGGDHLVRACAGLSCAGVAKATATFTVTGATPAPTSKPTATPRATPRPTPRPTPPPTPVPTPRSTQVAAATQAPTSTAASTQGPGFSSSPDATGAASASPEPSAAPSQVAGGIGAPTPTPAAASPASAGAPAIVALAAIGLALVAGLAVLQSGGAGVRGGQRVGQMAAPLLGLFMFRRRRKRPEDVASTAALRTDVPLDPDPLFEAEPPVPPGARVIRLEVKELDQPPTDEPEPD